MLMNSFVAMHAVKLKVCLMNLEVNSFITAWCRRSLNQYSIIKGATAIGDYSCLYSNACEKSSGNRSIADSACQSFKACESYEIMDAMRIFIRFAYKLSYCRILGSNSSGVVVINSDTCNYNKACMSLSGYSVITHEPSASPTLSPTSPTTSPTFEPEVRLYI